jgi:hypothetical protein
MNTDFDFKKSSLSGSIIFRSAFNTFEPINATQAWSLLFTTGRKDKFLGLNPKVGRRLTSLLFAIAAAGIIRVLMLHPAVLG